MTSIPSFCTRLQLPLSYRFADAGRSLQLQHDYILGNYPIGRDDAAQLSALQILAEIGFLSTPESCT